MSIKDAIDLLFAARERIDFYWNFYVVVVIAVVGWIVTRKEPLTRSTRILVTAAYLIAGRHQSRRPLRLLLVRRGSANRSPEDDRRLTANRDPDPPRQAFLRLAALVGLCGSRRSWSHD